MAKGIHTKRMFNITHQVRLLLFQDAQPVFPACGLFAIICSHSLISLMNSCKTELKPTSGTNRYERVNDLATIRTLMYFAFVDKLPLGAFVVNLAISGGATACAKFRPLLYLLSAIRTKWHLFHPLLTFIYLYSIANIPNITIQILTYT